MSVFHVPAIDAIQHLRAWFLKWWLLRVLLIDHCKIVLYLLTTYVNVITSNMHTGSGFASMELRKMYKMISSGTVMLQFNTGRGIVHHQGI